LAGSVCGPRTIGVSIGPGWTELHRMLSLACCTAVALVKRRTPPLLAAYAAEVPGAGAIPAPDEILIIEPPPARRIAGRAYFVPKNTPFILMPMRWSQSSSVVSSIAP